MMKFLINGMLAAVAVSLFSLGAGHDTARAADLPVKAPPVPAIYGWSGFYVGGTLGYGWRDNRATTFAQADPLVTAVTCGGTLGGTCAPPASSGLSGGVFGFQAGYNWQFASRWLLGVETDINFSSISGSATSAPYRIGLVTAQNTVDQSIDWFGTVRARLGFLATDRLLVYGTGGFAYAQVGESSTLTALTEQGANGLGSAFGCQAITNSAPTCFVGSSSRTATG
jgi:outer membrane immunogenic protein